MAARVALLIRARVPNSFGFVVTRLMANQDQANSKDNRERIPMKKMIIVALVVSAALAACGGKKTTVNNTNTGSGAMNTGSGDMVGSGDMGSGGMDGSGSGSSM